MRTILMKSKKFIHIVAGLLLVLISGLSNAQVSEAFFEHFTVDEGLSQSSVNCIVQGKVGFLWLGTQDGLNKYDGYKFKHYQHSPLDTNSISSNWIYAIDDDTSGIIWIGTQYGLNKLYQRSDKIVRYIHNPKKPSSISENEVFGVLVDRFGTVWAKTEKALNKLDTATGKFTRFEHEIDYFGSNKSDKGFPLLEDEEGIWVGSATGLHFFNRKLEQFKSYTHNPGDVNSISDNFITGLVFDGDKTLWVATRYGINKFNKKTKKFEHFFHDFTEEKGLSANQINSICYGHDGYIWVATYGGGLNKLNPKTGDVQVFQNQPNNKFSISSQYLNFVLEDKSYNLWIGTDDQGLDKYDLKPKKFLLYRDSKGSNSLKLSENIIASIYEADNGDLWVGTWDYGLDIVNRKTGVVKNYSTNSPPGERIIGDNVHVIMPDSKGLIWLGTKKGISIYDKKTKKFTDLNKYYKFKNFPNLDGSRIYSILEDYKGNVWVGTTNGLNRFNISDLTVNTYWSTYADTLSLFDNQIIYIMGDRDGYIWIGTKAGLNRFDYKTNKFFRIGSVKDGRTYAGKNKYYQISNSYIEEILEDSIDGSIWIGTASGLNRYDKRNATFQYFTDKDGLPNETIYELEQDKNGNIWMSTNHGIAMLDRKTFKIRSYDRADGLQGLEFNNGASFISKSGEIFFGGTNGFNSFNPSEMNDNPFIPTVVFTTFEKISNGNKIILNIEKVRELELAYTDHSLTFNFAALEFTKSPKNSYMYMMEGLNNSWIQIGNRNFQDFGTLAPGEYVLRVKGSNNDLVWNDKEISIRIIVNPPIFKSIYAYITYILLIFTAIYLYVRSRTKKLQKANDALRIKQLAALEIAKQREELAVKNKSITDSINYAKRIQEAMLPSEYLFRKLLPDSFIFYNPKDIVSGDFYWVTEKESKIFIAAVDCTGHGVPGAFMSIIGFDLLRNITKEQGVENPAQILNLLNLGISETFSKHANESAIKDGMDVSLLVIDRNNKVLEYAGAFNPLYIARENKIIEVKGNRFAVGKMEGNEDLKFDNHIVSYRENDMLYIFSDGYADQFGGPLGKKFKFRRFRHLLLTINGLPLLKQKAFLEENFESWKGQLEQVDDILVIGIKL
ncbi:MAG: SpoIIE family protein phosphatase [Bacteroidia bacterium]|nr:SpoIIE family protein phosphatase [Bacteroidia bacterium]